MRKVITGSGKNVRAYAEKFGDNLILFPETRLDINEQANFILNNKEDKDILTLSPWIISDTKEENLFILNDDLSLEESNFNTYGASVNKISFNILNRKSTIGEKAKKELELYKENIDQYTVSDIDFKFGESVEKILLIKCLFDKEEANV